MMLPRQYRSTFVPVRSRGLMLEDWLKAMTAMARAVRLFR